MRRYNDGMIYTNDRCVACNHCVHVCPAVGANVSARDESGISIDVSDKNCIHCGLCISGCSHRARKYTDSLEDMLLDIKRGTQVSVIVDPTFIVAYGREYAGKVFGYLKSIGIKGIYDGAIGGDISLFGHIKYLRENMDENGMCEKFYAHTCPGYSNYVSRYAPAALDKFIPVQLPSVCAAIYYRKYKGVKDRFALLSPCTAIYDEFSSYNTGRNINYLIGFSSLMGHIGDTDISSFEGDFDESEGTLGRTICENDAFTFIVSRYFSPKFLFKSRAGIDLKLEKVVSAPSSSDTIGHPSMVAVDLCRTGCIDGPAIDKRSLDMRSSIPEYMTSYRNSMKGEDDGDLSPDERYQKLLEKFSFLNIFDFYWEGEEDYHQKCRVPESVVNEIFESMHKTTKVKRELDCQACGYKSCYEMVCAVANGYSRIEDCVHYLNDEMKNQMMLDSLTGLFNQRGFFRAATKLIGENPDKKYMLVVCDINGLGGINDLYSNTGGDLVISYVAKVIEEFSDGRGVCGRMGAGTFGCAFENTPENIEKFKEDTQLSVAHLGIEYPLTLKCGIYGIDNKSVSIGRAALYATYAYRTSKDRSRNTYIFYTEKMTKKMSEEAEVTQKMKRAMENREFVLYRQPKYDHATGKMVGAEVLSRWVRSDGSIVSPGLFIPVFEKNGYITELDRFVWRSSFEMVDAWVREGYSAVPVSVNISRISLVDESITDVIRELKDKYPEACRFIQFEITESAYADNVEEIFARVQTIRDMGFRVNMDDFGSGYSSLNLLKDAPIDIIKLDMGFLRGHENMDKGNIIISSVVNMTRQLGFDIVAEGVETKEQADLLSGMGCNVIQGFYYARPMPQEEFVRLF